MRGKQIRENGRYYIHHQGTEHGEYDNYGNCSNNWSNGVIDKTRDHQ